jgi:transposase InsO family protein
MSKARLVITAVVVEGRGVREVARDYGVSPGWVSKLVTRYRAEGDTAFDPKSRRPNSTPTATPSDTVKLIIDLRRRLIETGDDAGAETIRWHLAHQHGVSLSAATIGRYLHRAGLITPQPHKRPRSSYVRFAAEQPNETWQADFTHYRLEDRTDVEILCWLDDHARYALRLTAHQRVTGPIVLNEFRAAVAQHGVPASTLTDNGMVFTTRFAGGKGGRNSFEAELRRLNITQKNSRPNHPTTCGKVERFHQTLKRWLTAQPDQPDTIAELQTLLDRFLEHYNHERPHRSLPERCTPADAYQRRPKATARDRADTHDRVRHDTVDTNGKITLRVNGRMHHIGLGSEHRRTRVIVLVHDLEVRVVHDATGELIRKLTIDPTKDYQPLGRPPGPKPRQQPR